MTDRIDELQRLHEAATKGPWRAIGSLVDGDDSAYIGVAECYRPSNAELIAAMRNALPALLRVARAARKVLDGSEVDGWHTPLREVDVAELREALGELERDHG